ncbi:MAG TPA: ATP-binding protein [Methylophilaceae bacterium]|nr:ATP-binding protein [Methylophilaceae bacterium]
MPTRLHSIRNRLSIIVLATSFAALLITIVALAIYDLQRYRNMLTKDLSTQAELIGRASIPALQFDDAKLARTNLLLLEVRPNIVSASLYDEKGILISSYISTKAAQFVPAADRELMDRVEIEGNLLRVKQRVIFNGETLGLIEIYANYEIKERLFSYLGILLAVSGLALLAALGLSRWLQQRITGPIQNVAELARKVVAQRDFSLRAVETPNDEITYLVNALNAMLEEMQARTHAQQELLQSLQKEIAERKQVEAELKEARDQLEVRVQQRTAELLEAKLEADRANKAKSDFLSRTSHELRTPLNSIIILSELLATDFDKYLKEADIKAARTIYEAAQDLLSLVNDLLDLAQIESGSPLLIEKSEIDWGRLRTIIENMFSETAKRKNLAFDILISDQLPADFRTDEKRLLQILKNLLANAFKFTREGKVSLTIAPISSGWRSWRPPQGMQQAIVFAVSDTGIGIPEDKLQIIFEAFQQADGSITRKFGGTGLGLAISRELAVILDGTIDLESHPEVGSTFRLYLPMQSDASEFSLSGETPPNEQ